MPNVTAFSSGPQIGNRLTAQDAVQSIKDVSDKRNLNAIIGRISEMRSSIGDVSSEGERIGNAISSDAETAAEIGAENRKELQGAVRKGIQGLQGRSSQDIAGKTAVIQSRNQLSPVDMEKGLNIDTQA